MASTPGDARVKDVTIDEEAYDQRGQCRQCTVATSRHARVDQHCSYNRGSPNQETENNANTARAPRAGCGRHGNQHSGQAAKRDEAHDTDVKQASVAPLQVHAQRHDG